MLTYISQMFIRKINDEKKRHEHNEDTTMQEEDQWERREQA